MRRGLVVVGGFLAVFAAWGLAQDSAVRPSDLPSVDAKSKIPQLDSAAVTPDFSDSALPESPSIPKLRAPDKEPEKAKDQDWAAQAMLQKKEDAKKKEQEQAAFAEQKARESQQALEKEKKEKAEEVAKASRQPAVAKPAADGFGETDAQKLPVVTGMEGVKPRALASGDGRVQPSFDSFTGPSSASPLAKDYQSGAKPIMPGSASSDGRMQVPPQPPSGAYKKISQDPYSSPPSLTEKKSTAPSPPKPVVATPNPPSGDPKRVIENSKAGLSPYDNSKVVPDPRSQRRF